MFFTFHIRFSLTLAVKMSFWLQGQDGQSVDVAEVSTLYLSKFMYCVTTYRLCIWCAKFHHESACCHGRVDRVTGP